MDLTYLDSNATTQPASEVIAKMMQCLTDGWGNPSSAHRFGQEARRSIDEARAHVAALVNCTDRELTFMSGGSEAINTSIRGLLLARTPRRKIITSSTEHSATKESTGQYAREGYEVVEIGVDHSGQLDMDAYLAALDDNTALVTMLWANNETGTIFPMEKIAAAAKAKKNSDSRRPDAVPWENTGRPRRDADRLRQLRRPQISRPQGCRRVVHAQGHAAAIAGHGWPAGEFQTRRHRKRPRHRRHGRSRPAGERESSLDDRPGDAIARPTRSEHSRARRRHAGERRPRPSPAEHDKHQLRTIGE